MDSDLDGEHLHVALILGQGLGAISISLLLEIYYLEKKQLKDACTMTLLSDNCTME